MFGVRIKELRKSLGLNQVEFARRLNVTKQSICNWENGNILPSIDMLSRISREYSVSTDFLLGLVHDRSLDVTGLTNEQVAHLQYIVDDLRNSRNV